MKTSPKTGLSHWGEKVGTNLRGAHTYLWSHLTYGEFYSLLEEMQVGRPSKENGYDRSRWYYHVGGCNFQGVYSIRLESATVAAASLKARKSLVNGARERLETKLQRDPKANMEPWLRGCDHNVNLPEYRAAAGHPPLSVSTKIRYEDYESGEERVAQVKHITPLDTYYGYKLDNGDWINETAILDVWL